MVRRFIINESKRRCYAAQHAFQKTLTLPCTNFPKRSNFREAVEILIPQSSQQVYDNQLDKFLLRVSEFRDDTAKLKFVEENLFVLHDGPPYANGDLHLGHALNKILKDIINRYQLSKGKYIFYKPGWDCHGLPIEMKALKDINNSKLESIPPSKIRSMASIHATKAIEIQKKQFEKFGIMTNWVDRYTTMDSGYELNQLEIFRQMFTQGLIKRQNKPVYWGAETRTALAEGELEYNENHKSMASYVKFPLTSDSNLKFLQRLPDSAMIDFFVEGEANEAVSCLIWTTTPWTLVANRAICYNEKFTYSLVQLESDYLIVGSELIDALNLPEPYKVLAEFPGSMLHGLEYTNPMLRDGITRPLLQADYVTSSAGTGLVHNAPGHGSDDYLVGLKHNLEIFSPVDHRGRYNLGELPEHLHEFLKADGLPMNVADLSTSAAIVKLLDNFSMLHKCHEYSHSYPYDWRSKKPVIVRATPQWFADLQDVKPLALESIIETKFTPERGKTRLSSFVESRNEWCISRQRSWGVPIPALYEKDRPDVVIMTEETIEHAIKVIRKKGINAWFSEDQSDMEEWLPPSMQGQGKRYFRGKDTMDVWFDSGTSWNVVKDFYEKILKLKMPPSPLADVYLEGSDQHRGWFQSSLLTKVASSGISEAPYKQVITHGFTLDEKGIKMSKSIGNTISPETIINGNKKLGIPALGVDGLRYLVAQADFTTDIVAGKTVITRVAESLKKFRLTFRFLLGNLTEGSFALLPLNELRAVDRFTMFRLKELLESTKRHYDDYNFSKVLTAVQYHMTNELSAFYFNVSKDCLYSDEKNSLKRQQIQTTLFHIYDSYRAILMPLLPILIQESWNHLPKQYFKNVESLESPFVRPWPSFEVTSDNEKAFLGNELAIRKEFQRQFIELARSITTPSQTIATVSTNASDLTFTSEELSDLLQTSKVHIHTNVPEEDLNNPLTLHCGAKVTVKVQESDMKKCPRCWYYNATADEQLCSRCETVTKEVIH